MITVWQDTKKTLNIRGRLINLSSPVVMGIVNVTPDSFYAESRISTFLNSSLVDKVGEMLAAGAGMIDVGGYSTRPGAAAVSEAEEIDRVVPAVEMLIKNFPDCIISVDTFRSKVLHEAVLAGAAIANDVSGGDLDPDMFEVVAKLHVPYILMHMRGTPETMNALTDYTHLTADVIKDLQKKMAKLRELGVVDVIIDPGYGFAKTREQNFELLRNLSEFRVLNCPLLVGISRKRMIWETLNIQSDQALNGTTVLNTMSLLNGASILRVHDVKEAVEAVKLFNAYTTS